MQNTLAHLKDGVVIFNPLRPYNILPNVLKNRTETNQDEGSSIALGNGLVSAVAVKRAVCAVVGECERWDKRDTRTCWSKNSAD